MSPATTFSIDSDRLLKMRLLECARLVRVAGSTSYPGGFETEEQLDTRLAGLRDECATRIGTGKKELVQ